MSRELPKASIILGLAGLLPQAACLVIVSAFPAWQEPAVASACYYAAIILSFLGGMWWMQGLASNSHDAAPYVLGILPALVAWVTLLSLGVGWSSPTPSLLALAISLAVSPLADRVLQKRLVLPETWPTLRRVLAVGLAAFTIAIAVTSTAASH